MVEKATAKSKHAKAPVNANGDIAWGSLVEMFLQRDLSVSPTYARHIQRSVELVGHDLRVSDFTAGRLAGYVDQLRCSGNSDSTIYLRLAGVKRVFAWYRQTTGYDQSPFTGFEEELDRPKGQFNRALSDGDLERFLEESGKFTCVNYQAAIDAAIRIFTVVGISQEEVLALRVKDVIPPWLFAGEGDRRRRVPLYELACDHSFLRYLRTRQAEDEPNAPFIVGKGGRPMTESKMSRNIKAIAEKAGVSPSIRPQTLRYSAALAMDRAGHGLAAIQEAFGYKNRCDAHNLLARLKKEATISEENIDAEARVELSGIDARCFRVITAYQAVHDSEIPDLAYVASALGRQSAVEVFTAFQSLSEKMLISWSPSDDDLALVGRASKGISPDARLQFAVSRMLAYANGRKRDGRTVTIPLLLLDELQQAFQDLDSIKDRKGVAHQTETLRDGVVVPATGGRTPDHAAGMESFLAR